jgi:hypothetical protein
MCIIQLPGGRILRDPSPVFDGDMHVASIGSIWSLKLMPERNCYAREPLAKMTPFPKDSSKTLLLPRTLLILNVDFGKIKYEFSCAFSRVVLCCADGCQPSLRAGD